MQQDEIDKIIAEAIAEDKKKSRKKWHKSHNGDAVATARKVLNWAFMLGFAVALIIYFLLPEQRTLFFCIGFGSIMLNLVEFYLRFLF